MLPFIMRPRMPRYSLDASSYSRSLLSFVALEVLSLLVRALEVVSLLDRAYEVASLLDGVSESPFISSSDVSWFAIEGSCYNVCE